MPEHFNPLRDKMLYGGPRCAGEIRFYELRLLAHVFAPVKHFICVEESNKKRAGEGMGGGEGEPLSRQQRGSPSPQLLTPDYICSAAKSARRAKREPSALSMARRFRRRAASSHMTMTPSKKASTAGRTSSSVFRAAA